MSICYTPALGLLRFEWHVLYASLIPVCGSLIAVRV